MSSIFLWLLGRLGTWLWPVIGVAALGMLATIGWLNYRVDDLKEDVLLKDAKYTEERLLASRASQINEAKSRAQEKQWRDGQQEKIDAAEQTITQMRADRVIADAAAGRLLERFTALVARAREAARDSTPGQAGPPAPDPYGVLADVFESCVRNVRRLAAIADERGAAGQLCEQSYDALMPVADSPR